MGIAARMALVFKATTARRRTAPRPTTTRHKATQTRTPDRRVQGPMTTPQKLATTALGRPFTPVRKVGSTTSTKTVIKFMFRSNKRIATVCVLISLLFTAGCAAGPQIKSWEQVSGKTDFEVVEVYCKQMDALASKKAAEALTSLFLIGAASSSGSGKYAAQNSMAATTGALKGINSRPPTPDGMPYMECMNSYGWVARY
jgi:hypothetical protein